MNFKFSNPMPINFPTDTVGEEFGSSDDEQPPVDDEYLTINNRAKINLIKPKTFRVSSTYVSFLPPLKL